MSIKNLVEMIKRNGLLASMEQLEKLYQVAIENEQKLAESEARCAAMAAENARLKDLAMGWANATDDRLFEEHGEIFHDSIDACEEELKTICPATDAFLAEVRASELDSLAGVAETMIVKFANQGASEIPEAKVWEMIYRQASQRASQLRKGVQS